jgi:transposase
MINSTNLFALALNVSAPWKVEEVEFENTPKSKELHIKIDFERGAKFPDETGALCGVHDTKEKVWRHLNFFEHKCYLHCRVPRIKTKAGKVKLIDVPWARSGSGFTLLFEAFVMCLIEGEMPVNKVGRLVKEEAHRIWTIFNYWIKKAYNADETGKIKRLGIDETSRKKGHKYVTVGVDFESRRVLHATEGKDKKAIRSIRKHLESKGTDINKIKYVCIDFSQSFIPAVKEEFPKAQIHFDKFHLIQMLNKAMDEVRKLERKEHDELKGHKYTFLKKQTKLSKNKQDQLAKLIKPKFCS